MWNSVHHAISVCGGALTVQQPKRIRVHYFFRKPRKAENYSVERLFGTVTSELPQDRFIVRHFVCPLHSTGVIRRLMLMVWAGLNQGDINHLTGDIDFVGLLMRKRQTVVTILDAGSLHRLRGWRRKVYELFWLRLPLMRAGQIITISEATRQEIEPFAVRAKHSIKVIPACVTVRPESCPRQFRSSCPRVLHVGTKPNKNLERVVAALRGLGCELVVIGKLTQEQSHLLEQSEIRYENHVGLSDRELIDQYHAADLVTFVSTYEGFGLPILEAQALGRPLITSDREPMWSVAGTGAKLVDPTNVDELRRGIQDIIQDAALRKTLIRAGLENVKRFSPASVASRYATLYQEMYKPACQ